MLPLFSKADLNSLINNNNYKFTGILLFDEFLNSEFQHKLDKDLKNLHVSTGKDLMICTFLPPAKSWLEKNYIWYETIILNNSKVNTDLNRLINEYSKNRSVENYVSLKEIISEESIDENLSMQSNLMKMFGITNSDLPTLILYNKINETIGVLKNQTVEDLSMLASTLSSAGSKHFDISLTPDFKDKFQSVIINCSKSYHEDFFDFADFINSKKVNEKDDINPITELKKEYPEFEELKYPNRFFWNKSLMRCLRLHKNLIRHYIDGINYIEENINIPGLDKKQIKNFWRFRINRNFRALYYIKDNKNVHFYLGHHDYGLSRNI